MAGVGPFGADDLDFLAGMGPENVAEFGAAMEGEQALRMWLAESAEPFRSVTGEGLAQAFGGLVSEVCKDVLVGGYTDLLATVTRRSREHGLDGWFDDDLAFTHPWGFSVGDIRVPVTVWQGELDLMVPLAHGRWLVSNTQEPSAEWLVGTAISRWSRAIVTRCLQISSAPQARLSRNEG